MQEVFEKIKEKISQEIENVIVKDTYSKGKNAGLRKAKIFIDEIAAEYNNGWIPCSEPPKAFREENRELIPFLVCDEESQYPYRAFYDGKNWGDGFSKLNPIAWKPLPEPYQPKGE